MIKDYGFLDEKMRYNERACCSCIGAGKPTLEQLEIALRHRDMHLAIVLIEGILRGDGSRLYTAGLVRESQLVRLTRFQFQEKQYLMLFTSEEQYRPSVSDRPIHDLEENGAMNDPEFASVVERRRDTLITLPSISHMYMPVVSKKYAHDGIIINPFTYGIWVSREFAAECIRFCLRPPEYIPPSHG